MGLKTFKSNILNSNQRLMVPDINAFHLPYGQIPQSSLFFFFKGNFILFMGQFGTFSGFLKEDITLAKMIIYEQK